MRNGNIYQEVQDVKLDCQVNFIKLDSDADICIITRTREGTFIKDYKIQFISIENCQKLI